MYRAVSASGFQFQGRRTAAARNELPDGNAVSTVENPVMELGRHGTFRQASYIYSTT
jgi:hypothetical protein